MGAICERTFYRLNNFISWSCGGICLALFLFLAQEFLNFHYILSRFLVSLNMVLFKDLPPPSLLWLPIRPEDLESRDPSIWRCVPKAGHIVVFTWVLVLPCRSFSFPFHHPHESHADLHTNNGVHASWSTTSSASNPAVAQNLGGS